MASEIKLNEFQQTAVDFPHDRPAVVTAAAGSGKTTLLVRRVIRLLSDPALGIAADELAIMTFTRNATKSMRERLSNALSEELAELSGRSSAEDMERYEYLRRQLFSLRRAYISTIDAFCLRLIKENAEAFDLPINLSVADGARKAAMQSQALKAAMNDFYGDGFSEKERDTLFFSFSFEDDAALSETLISVSEKLSTFPDADRWIAEAEGVYADIPAMERHFLPLLGNWLELNVKRIGQGVESYRREDTVGCLRSELDELIGAGGSKAKTAAMTLDEIFPVIQARISLETKLYEQLERDFSAYKDAPSLEALSALAENVRKNAGALPQKPNGRSGSRTPCRIRFNALTDSIAAGIDALTGLCFDADEEKLSAALVGGALKTLYKLLKIYMGYYELEKRAASCIDFSDCERELYKKLSENGGDNDFRRAMAARFRCIIVDEFQDSNKIQAEIFRLLGGGRLFYVGDVKQSIYAFRGADPYIMAELCGDSSEGFTELPLNTNYRSRKAVIDTVNAAFSGLMTRQYGGTNYADGNGLNPGCDLPDPDDPELYDSEIYLLKTDRKELADGEADKDMVMPRFVAGKIKELCGDERFLVADGKDENGNYKFRRAVFSDFIILLRTKTKIDCYRKALSELNISSVTPKGSSFFDADEIKLVCNFLKIVDDPLLDEEFLKVMMSPVYRFTAGETAGIRAGIAGLDLPESELAEIAASYRRLSLYTCLCDCLTQKARRGKQTVDVRRSVPAKAERLYNDLRAFRYYASSCSLDDLIRRIYEDTDFVSIVAAFEDSEGRVENIRRFRLLAADFEARGGNLGDFLRFIDRARENASKGIEEAARPQSTADSVSIMTFHGSKGLEAPVCIMAELQNTMNGADYSGNFLINADRFTAIKHTDIKTRRKTKPIAYTALSRFIRERQLGEELRLLYVAMTRAKEKLIMVSCIGKTDFEKFGEYIEKTRPGEPRGLIYENTAPFRCVLSSIMEHAPATDSKELKLDGIGCRITALAPNVGTEAAVRAAGAEIQREYSPSEEDAREILAMFGQRYEHAADTQQQAKFTATELAHKKGAKPISLTRPDFIEKKDVSGVEKGNAYHHCMQNFPLGGVNADMSREELSEAVSAAVDGLERSGRITQRERGIIDDGHLVKLFSSDLGKRMLRAYSQSPGNVRREQSFYAEVNGNDVRQEYAGSISVQGQIDAYFIENGELVVLDYKSDTIRNLEKELDNYRFQVEIYTGILKKLTGMNVKEMYLYSFLADKEIKV